MNKKADKKYPKVYIIILNYNNWGDTIECLETVLRNDYPNYQVIVADNNSPNNSLKYIKNWVDGKQEILTPKPSHPLYHLSHPLVKKQIPYIEYNRDEAEKGGNFERENKLMNEWRNERTHSHIETSIYSPISPSTNYPLIFIQTGENLGFAGGDNVALRMILNRNEKCFVWLLNPDMVIEKDSLMVLIESMKSFSKEEIVLGTTVKSYKKPNKILFYGGAKINLILGNVFFIKKIDDIKELSYISGGSFFTLIDNFKKFGELPENYFLYWEDADWCTNFINKGGNLFVSSKSICYDKGGNSIGRNSYSAEYYYTLNYLKYLNKYYSNKFFILKFSILPRLIYNFFNLKLDKIKAIIKAFVDI